MLIDDSIVRGTQLRETTEFLYQSGAKEVHIRPACPPLVYGCKYLNFSRSSSEMDLITRRVIAKLEGTEDISEEVLQEYTHPESPKYDQMVEEIRKELNFTTLRYNRLDDMLAADQTQRSRMAQRAIKKIIFQRTMHHLYRKYRGKQKQEMRRQKRFKITVCT